MTTDHPAGTPAGFAGTIPREQDPMTFIVDTQFRIQRLMDARGMNNRQLADALGVSKARISNMFGPQPNLTLETLAKVFLALGAELPRVTTDRLDMLLADDDQVMPPDHRRASPEWRISADTSADIARTAPAAASAPSDDGARPRAFWQQAAA